MSILRTFQPSFTAGELSPALWARVDLSKYGSGLKTALNLFIHPHGGASNRAGFEFINEVKTSAAATRLIPFQFNTEQAYILEFGNLYMRVYKNGALVLTGLGAIYELVTPYPTVDLDKLVITQESDVAYITDGVRAPRKLGRLADNNWTIGAVTFAPSIVAPTGLGGTAMYTRRSGATADISYRVSASNGALESAAAAAVTINVQFENDDGRLVRISWNASPGADLYRVYRSDGSTGVLVSTTETSVEISQTTYVGDGRTIPTTSDPGAPAVPTGVAVSIRYGQSLSYKVSAVSEETGEESLPSTAFSLRNDMSFAGNMNLLTWDAVAGASAYIIYRKDNGVYGFIGRSETTSFTDENITADIADGPQTAQNPFTGAGNFPKCSTFIEQRLGFGSTENEPQGVWLSQSANYENFGYASPAKASDAVTFRIRARQVNEIRSMLPLKGLMLLTSGAEWVVSGGSQSDAITPTAIKVDPQGYRGASKVQPIVVGNTVLFAQERGGVVRDFSYNFADDGFVGKDLTVLARHLFEGKSIKAWAYAQAPSSIVWVVLDDGSLVSLTYMKEHEVWAWTRHASAASAIFEDVAVIAEGREDVPYFIVRRTIGGVQKRYIERLHTRSFSSIEDAFFIDSGLTYTGAAATEITGLEHLEGQGVVALSNGNVVRNLTVTGGAVTLPNPTTKAHIGLPMEAYLQTLDLDLGAVQGLGTVQGRKKSVGEVTLRVEKTRGIFVGNVNAGRDEPNKLAEYKQRQNEAWNEAIQMYTGDIAITPHWDWSDGGNCVVKQFDPLPMTILAVMPDIVIGG
ncbi:hypothetical protein AX761_21730 [Rhizobium sp. 58]|nr:hypothetical protein AX761_21730 [Rhizobium sp. 58]